MHEQIRVVQSFLLLLSVYCCWLVLVAVSTTWRNGAVTLVSSRLLRRLSLRMIRQMKIQICSTSTAQRNQMMLDHLKSGQMRQPKMNRTIRLLRQLQLRRRHHKLQINLRLAVSRRPIKPCRNPVQLSLYSAPQRWLR